jgi:hypothetical protein
MPGQTPENLRERYPEIPSSATELQVQPIEGATATMSQIADSRRLVLRTDAEWRQHWAVFSGHISPTPESPVVDFGSDMVLVATSGTRTSGGHAIDIEGVFEADGELLVAVLETGPGAGCMTLQVMSAPATAVRVPTRTLPVRFVERSEETPCS